MNEAVVIKQFLGRIPPVYRGSFKGRPLTIKLDSSAILKLGSDSKDSDPIATLSAKRQTVALAAQRLIEMRQFDQVSEGMSVIISALDLD
jgi:hypothetical protein